MSAARKLPMVPVTRADCVDGPRPCPHTTCRYHLWRPEEDSAHAQRSRTKSNGETCALDLAERGGMTLEEVGEAMGVSRERVRQLETKALIKLKRGRLRNSVDDPDRHSRTFGGNEAGRIRPLKSVQDEDDEVGDAPLDVSSTSATEAGFLDGDDESVLDSVWRSYLRASEERRAVAPDEESEGMREMKTVPYMGFHVFVTVFRDENDDRIRTLERCQWCGVERHGCFAKRLSDVPGEAGNRQWWGPVGVWTHSLDEGRCEGPGGET